MNRRFVQSSSLFLFLFFLFVFAANGQDDVVANKVNDNKKITINESFELGITEKTIVEKDFERSTMVEVSEPDNGISVGVGVSVRAKNLTMTLRGITGNVGFRASLESIRLRLERRTESTFKP